MTALQIPDLEPGSQQWLQYMSASKIAAVVGLSPYESRRSLWHLMHGDLPAPEQTDAMARGHYLEDGIARWFADRHPEYAVNPGGTWTRTDRRWATATPDRLLADDTGQTVALLQIKTAGDMHEWGTAGSDEIPPGYQCQVMWEMETCQIPVCFVAVLLPNLAFREYRVDYNPAAAKALVARASEFMDSLAFHEPPNLDGDDHTYAAVRALDPEIDRAIDHDMTPKDAARFVAAKHGLEAAKEAWNLERSRLCEAMGTARQATCLGDKIAIRKRAKPGAAPYVEAAKTLPDLTSIDLKEAA